VKSGRKADHIDSIQCTAAAPTSAEISGYRQNSYFIQEDNVPTWEKEARRLFLSWPNTATTRGRGRQKMAAPLSRWMPVPQAKFKAAYGFAIQAQKNEFLFVARTSAFSCVPKLTPKTVGSSVMLGDSIAQNFSFIVSVDEPLR